MQDQINALSKRLETCKTEVGQQLELGNARMDALDTSIKDALDKLDTILELFNSFEGFFKVMGWIGKGAVWIAKIGAIVGGAWLTVKHFFGIDI